MDKGNLQIVLRESFEKDNGVCVIFHFIDGSELLINQLPFFFNLHMLVDLEYFCDEQKIVESVVIPYSSVLYLSITSNENLKIINDFEFKKRMNEYKLLESSSSGVFE